MKKIYLGNTLIHDEKEYNEMKENIQNLQSKLDESLNPTTWTAEAFNATQNPTPNTIPVRDYHNSLAINHITRNIENFNFTAAGWYRIYVANNGTNIGQSIRVTINSGFAYTSNSSYTFEINIGWDSTVINQYASIAEYNVVDKIRVSTCNQANTYIDIHYGVSNVNNLYFSVDGLGTLQILQDPEVPSDYRTTEFTTVDGFKSQINDKSINLNTFLSGYTADFSNWNAIPCTTKLYSGRFYSDVTIGLSGVIPPGEDITLILYNDSTSNKTISLTNFPTRNVDTITVPPSEKAEINILGSRNDANTESYYYVRGILYKD